MLQGEATASCIQGTESLGGWCTVIERKGLTRILQKQGPGHTGPFGDAEDFIWALLEVQ